MCFVPSCKTLALEVSTPGQMVRESDLEGTKTVLGGGSSGGSVSSGNVRVKGVPSVQKVSSTPVIKAEFEGLDMPVLVLEDDFLTYRASNSNLKKEALKSVGANSTIYGSLTYSTAITLFDHYVSGLPPFTKYVAWRETQYVYTLVYGDIEYSNGRFTGNGEYVRFDTASYNDYTVSHGSVSSFGLNPGNYIVYSNFEGFASLGGGVKDEIKTLLFASFMLYIMLFHILSCVPRGFKK